MTIAGQRGNGVPVDAQIGERVLVLKVEGVDVGSWAIEDVRAEPTGAGVSLLVDGETVVIDVTDRIGFLGALQRPVSPGEHRRRRRLPSLALTSTVALLVGVAAAAVFFPEVAGPVLILLGLVALVVGAAGHAESRVALRLPLGLQPGHFLVVGLVVTAIGVGVTLLA
jgi:hypothetical protein